MRGIVWSTVLLVSALLVLYVFRDALVFPRVVAWAKAKVERDLGGELELTRVEGNLFTELRLEGLTLRTPDSALREITNARIELDYSALDLFRDGMTGLHHARIAADEIAFAFESYAEPAQAEPDRETWLPRSLPGLELDVETLTLDVPDLQLESRLRDVNGHIGRSNDPNRVELSVGALELESPTVSASSVPDEPLRAAGSYAPQHPFPLQGELQLELERASAWGRSVEHLSGRIGLEGDRLVVPEMAVVAERNRASVADLALPLDALANLAQSPGARELDRLLRRIDGSVRLEGSHYDALFASEKLPSALTAREHELSLEVAFDASSTVEVLGALRTSGGEFEMEQGRIRLPDQPIDGIEDLFFELDSRLDFDSLAALGQVFGRSGWEGSLAGELALNGRWPELRGTLQLQGSGVELESAALGEVVARADIDPHELTLHSLEFDSRLGQGSASGALALDGKVLSDAALEVDVRDLSKLFPGAPLHQELVLSARLDGPLEEPEGSVRVESEGIAFEHLPIDTLRLEARLAEGEARVDSLELMAGAAQARATGTIERLGDGLGLRLLLDTLVADGGAGSLRLVEPTTIEISPTEVQIASLALASDAGTATIALERSAAGTIVDARFVDFDPSPLLALAPTWLAGPFVVEAVAGEVRARLAGQAPSLEVDLRGLQVRPGAKLPIWTADVVGSWQNARAEVRRVELSSPGLGTLRAQGSLPYTSGDLWMQAGVVELSLETDQVELAQWSALLPDRDPAEKSAAHALLDQLAGLLSVELEANGTWAELSTELDIRATNLTRQLETGVVGPLEVELRASHAQGELVPELRLSGDGLGDSRVSGIARIPSDGTRWWSDARATLESCELDLELTAELDDLSLVAKLSETLRRLEGRANASGRLTGALLEPIWEGRLSLEQGSLRLANDFPSLEALETELDFTPRRMEIASLSGEIGGSPFQLEGAVALGDAAELDLRFRGENLLLERTATSKVRGDVDLRIGGTLEALEVQGEVGLVDARFVQQIDLLAALQPGGGTPSAARGFAPSFFHEKPLSDLSFDVRLGAKNPVQLKNNVFDARLRPQLALTGTGRVPLLRGPVYFEESTLSLPSGRLRIESGLIRFREEDPFFPELVVSASMRIKGYAIDAQISGRFDRPEIVLSSSPPLANDDLLVLFLTGQLPEGGSGDRNRRAAETVAVYLAQDIALRWLFEMDPEAEASLLDRLELEVGAEVTREGSSTIKATYYLTDRQRGVGRTPYLTAERDLYDKINFGVGWLFRFR